MALDAAIHFPNSIFKFVFAILEIGSSLSSGGYEYKPAFVPAEIRLSCFDLIGYLSLLFTKIFYFSV